MKQITKIPLLKIREPREPLRDSIAIEKIDELASSMKEVGLLHPILVRREGEEYVIEAGHRRFLAAVSLNWLDIDAIVLEGEDPEGLHLERAHENLIREDLNIIDEARLVEKLVYTNDKGVEETARLLKKTRYWVESRLDVLRFYPDVQEALRKKEIPLAVAHQLQRVKDDSVRTGFLNSAINYGATAATVKGWVDNEKTQAEIAQREQWREAGENQAVDTGAVRMRCRLCREFHDIDTLRHLWFCPECLILVNELQEAMEDERREGVD